MSWFKKKESPGSPGPLTGKNSDQYYKLLAEHAHDTLSPSQYRETENVVSGVHSRHDQERSGRGENNIDQALAYNDRVGKAQERLSNMHEAFKRVFPHQDDNYRDSHNAQSLAEALAEQRNKKR